MSVKGQGDSITLDGTYREHDDILLPDREIIDEFADVIGDVRPDIIITHHPQDSVVAHSATGQMALLAMEAAHGMRAGKPYLPHKVKQVYYNVLLGQATVLENAIPRIPTTVIDITDVVPKKARAMNRYLAQYYGDDSPLHRKVGEVFDAPLAGIQYYIPYAEAFLAHYPEVFTSLPLSEYTIELSERSDAEKYAFMTQMLLVE